MIKKNIIQIILVVTVSLILTLFISSWNIQKQSLESSRAQVGQFLLLSTQVERQLSQVDWADGRSIQEFIDRISAVPEIITWEMSDSKGNALNKGSFKNTTGLVELYKKIFYLPSSDLNQPINALVVQFDLSSSLEKPSIFSLTTFVVLITLIMAVSVILVNRLNWVVQLEEYSKLVLTTDDNRMINSKHQFHNIIGHAISQLILNNSHLVKSKTDLTNQIRKTTYIDEISELGNHLFFKAELQVRLHNQDEAESGLVVILSFLEPLQDDRILTDIHQIEIANQLKLIVEDVENSIVARLKDFEFVLLLPNFTAAQIDQFCKRLVKSVSHSVFKQPEEVHHFVDIGISTYKQGFDYYHVMAEADLALRNAQLQGANCWYIFGEPLSQKKSMGSLKWRTFLRDILDRRRISLYCQQLHYFKIANNYHHEILARIQHGDELLPAETFLAMAHQSGMSVEFDRLIFDSAIKHALYNDQFGVDFQISLNIFIPSLLDSKFADWLVAKISSYPELSQKIVIEVGEHLLRKNSKAVAPIMKQLSQLGVKWCIEHFGSIGEDQDYLNALPIHMVKINRRIVNNIATSSAQQLLFNSIIVSLKARNILVFAEAVEKQTDAEFIKKTEVDGAQGYFFDRPKALDADNSINLASA